MPGDLEATLRSYRKRTFAVKEKSLILQGFSACVPYRGAAVNQARYPM